MTLRKLKYSEIAAVRQELLLKQKRVCGVCRGLIADEDAVLDHDHDTGAIRGVLHRSCNALLGKIENNYRRYGVKNLAAFLQGAPSYLQKHQTNRTGLLHPTHKTPEEKRLARNEKARKARAARKGTK
jgi:hypothetical protein